MPGYALRFACASTLTLILITSYFVRCILYTIGSWMSSEFSFFATEGHREHREKKEIRLSGDQVGGNQERRRQA